MIAMSFASFFAFFSIIYNSAKEEYFNHGVPLEIVPKVILRYRGLKKTQIYVGKVSEHEAIRWMDILHGK
jgi:hypothetical protein